MQRCYARYVAGSGLEGRPLVHVLDVGGSDLNGSYREIFQKPQFAFTSADVTRGPGVQVVIEDPYRMPIDDGAFDIVISGQMLEHCEFFWLTFSEMVRVLRPGGYIFLIAPSAGPEFRYPVDCYRFYPDAYRALARWANCALVDVWQDERGPWKDLVGVFQRHGPPPYAGPCAEPVRADPESIVPGTAEEESVRGEIEYLRLLDDLHAALIPRCYLEIGVRFGHSLKLARGPAIGVDPAPAIREDLPVTTRVFTQSSDEFFESTVRAALPAQVDFAFIDGLHLCEAALRDFMNIERLAAPGALVVIDDILPNRPIQASRDRRTRVWTGDVWKLLPVLRRYRPDLVLVLLDTCPSGCLLIGGLEPANRVLWDAYNPVVREMRELGDPPVGILDRSGVISPLSPAFRRFLSALPGTHQTPNSRLAALRQLAIESQGSGS